MIPAIRPSLLPRESGAARAAFRVFLGIIAIGVAGLGWAAACSMGGILWNAPRLAPSFALAHGLPIYAVRASGAHLGWIYGPVFPVFFLPVTMVPNLTAAFMLAGLWNAATLLAPIGLAVRAAAGARAGVVTLTTLFGALLLLANPITNAAFFMLHVDGLCIAFGLAGCVGLQAATRRGWTPGFHLAAIAVILAIWTKQTAIMLVPATLCWLATSGSKALVARWLWCLAAYGGVVSIVVFKVFGPEELLFNLWMFHIRSPSAGGLGLLGSRMAELVAAGWLWWIALAAGLAVRKATPVPLSANARSLVGLLAWAAAWQIPMGLAASLKIGGGLNSLHALSYGAVAALVAGADWLVQARLAERPKAWRSAALVFAAASFGCLGAGYFQAMQRGVIWTPYRGQQELLDLARRSPGGIYLPWNPLITIISDRRVYPFDDALLCLWRAGLEPPRAAVQAAIPAGATVLYAEQVQSRFALRYVQPE
ncbi:MAG: hypothetical protein JWM88_2663 [Verrucomicrobia bacterium]|nr:hypothetical protein [Verrucomicrobiota bacterium]